MSEPTFGARARGLNASELLDLEDRADRTERFSAIDVAVCGVMVRALRGERVVQITPAERGDTIGVVGVPDELAISMRNAFQLEAQQRRGAWFLPDAVPIKAHALLFPALFRAFPRYAHALAGEEKGKFALSGNPDAMVVWSVLQPMADLLLAPVVLRVQKSGLLQRDEFDAAWRKVVGDFAMLGVDCDAQLAPFAWGGGWSSFNAQTQFLAKAALLNAISDQMTLDIIRRYRASVTASLVQQYYSKAKNGRAKRKQVITKEHARTLAGVFAGDWLGFVEYLGEVPHEEERIVTALPEPKLIVTGKDKAAEVAAAKGLPLEEVERILASYWNDSNSPVLERVSVLREYWNHFDSIHSGQARGMPPLWGLVEEGSLIDLESEERGPYRRELYRSLLPQQLLTAVDRSWSGTVFAKWPEAVVTELFPHTAMADTFGPALRFWHGCALTAWFVCEGPSSRTDIAGLAHYHRRELTALEDLGCAVHPQLFEELNGVRLGPEEQMFSGEQQLGASGLSISIRTSSGSRRAGFELLRDVITRHRRWWASQNLDRYLRAIWESELKATARQFLLMTEEKGKPPTLKQFAKHAVLPAQRWFGGDISMLYATMGQKLATKITRSARVPRDRRAFVHALVEELEARAHSGKRGSDDGSEYLRRLAGEGLTFLQLSEALGREPTLKEFAGKFEWSSKALADSPDAAWPLYLAAIEAARARVAPPR